MDANERTRYLYEEIPGYPKPPLIPLPEPDDLDSLGKLGIKSGSVSHWIVKTAMFATGFRAFQKQLPLTIESLLRQNNLRVPGLFTPVLSATLALEDDPRSVNPIDRAATLLFAARNLYEDITSGKLVPDKYRDQILEMGQYPNLFSTSQILNGKKVRIFKSKNVSHIIVAVARRFYSLNVGNLGTETTIEQLKEVLAELAHAAQQNRLKAYEPSPGILTCGTNGTQIKAFRKLQKVKINRESLTALRHSFLTLCLDLDSYPSSCAEAAFFAHSCNCANRWYHSALQLVVFGNAKACVICNFSAYVDGNTMMRASSEIQKRALKYSVENKAKSDFISLPPAKDLKWNIGRDIIQRARRNLRYVQDNQQATFEIQGIGRNFFTAHKIESVPAFILALQITAKRLTGKMVNIEQFLTMSKYRCMDLVTAIITTPEVIRFVDYVESGNGQGDQTIALLQEAINSQARESRKARQYLPLGIIFTLFLRSMKGTRRLYVMFIAALAAMLLRILGLIKSAQREVVVSHPEIYPEVPVVGRPGVRLPYVKYFGLHYQILEDKIVITVMPSVNWTIPNAEFISELQKSLKQIQLIIGRKE